MKETGLGRKAKGMEGEKRERREGARALLRGRLMEEMQDRCHMEDEELLERIEGDRTGEEGKGYGR